MTGGIAGGKSDVARVFRSQGAIVLSADDIAREIMRSNPEVKRKIRRKFGPSVYDRGGRLRKKNLAALIFSDDRQKKALNAIVHPAVIAELTKRIRREKRRRVRPMVVVEAALIYEAGVEEMFDYMVAVDAPQGERIRRIMKRDRLSRVDAARRIAAQLPGRTKAARADFLIRNSGDRSSLGRKAMNLYRLLERLGNSARPGAHS